MVAAGLIMGEEQIFRREKMVGLDDDLNRP